MADCFFHTAAATAISSQTPKRFGRALAEYLADVRPQTSLRSVFISCKAPLAGSQGGFGQRRDAAGMRSVRTGSGWALTTFLAAHFHGHHPTVRTSRLDNIAKLRIQPTNERPDRACAFHGVACWRVLDDGLLTKGNATPKQVILPSW